MNKQRLEQIIKIIILPFVEEDFLMDNTNSTGDSFDYVLEYGRTYTGFIQNLDNMNIRGKYEQEHKKIVQLIEQKMRMRAHDYESIDTMMLTFKMFYPEDALKECLLHGSIEDYYIYQIQNLAKSLLTFRDGKIAIRTWLLSKNKDGENDIFYGHDIFDKVEIWNIINRSMTTDVLVIMFYLISDLKDEDYLYYETGNISLADKSINHVFEKGLAENHIHFNASGSYQHLWEENMDIIKIAKRLEDETKPAFGDKIQLLLAASFRFLISDYINSKTEKNFLEYLKENDKNSAIEQMNFIYYYNRSLDISEVRKNFLEIYKYFCNEYWNNKKNIDMRKKLEEDYLLDYIFQAEKRLKTSSEIVFLFKVMRFIRNNNDIYVKRLFFQYVRMKNIFFKDVMQGNEILGLKNFKENYYDSVRKANTVFDYKNMYKKVFEHQAQNFNLKKLEIRIAPYINMKDSYDRKQSENVKRDNKRFILEQIREILMAYKEYIEDIVELWDYEINEADFKKKADSLYNEKNMAVPTMGIVYHFIKNDFIDNVSGDMCWVKYSLNTEEKLYSKHILIQRKKMVEFAKALEELRSEIPLLSEYVVGIDAASEEVTTEPWIMAPIYSAIRNKKITKPLAIGKTGNVYRVQNLGFTYHVGEEFRHILSGFRHVDEVIEHFKYKPGDRLGHATVLGVDVDYWVTNNEVVVMPIQEYLDNLLWLWGSIVYGRYQFNYSIDELEGKIITCVKEIYEDIHGMTIDMLYSAYQNRFFCDHNPIFEYMQNKLDFDSINMEKHFCKFYKSNMEQYWTEDKILCTFYCPVYQMKLRKPKFINVNKGNSKLFKEIQKQIIEKIERIGIYIETNPTSNLAIGSVENIFSHPIFKLNSRGLTKEDGKDDHCVLVTINSDDPIIFNTSNENEMAYIYHALVHEGYQREKIMDWIDKIRQMGLDGSFVKYVKLPSTIYEEVTKLLKRIEEMIGKYEDR